MIKAIIFDLDGVVVKLREKFFSQRLAEKQNLDIEVILPFFKGDYQLCATGKADLKEVLPKYFTEWRWEGTTDELLQFWFEAEKDLDIKLMESITELRTKGIKVGLATDNEKYRWQYLLKELNLDKKFVYTFLSSDLGIKKSNTNFFVKIIQSLGTKPEEICFWDDDQKNVDVALSLGINAFLYTNFNDFLSQLRFLGIAI